MTKRSKGRDKRKETALYKLSKAKGKGKEGRKTEEKREREKKKIKKRAEEASERNNERLEEGGKEESGENGVAGSLRGRGEQRAMKEIMAENFMESRARVIAGYAQLRKMWKY